MTGFWTTFGGSRKSGWAAALASIALVSLGTPAAVAQNFPSKEVKLIVPFPTGGITDLTARIIAKHLTKLWGQPVTVVNVAGGGGATGTMQVLGAPKDGYTMMLSATGQATQNPAIDSKLPYKWDDPTLVARTNVSPLVFVVKGSSQWSSLQQVIDDVRKDTPKYKWGSSGPGGVGSIAIALLMGGNGIDPQKLGKVTMQGGSGILDAVRDGVTDFAAQYLAEMESQLARKELKPLAVSTEKRVKQLPDTPTSREAGFPDFSLIGWNGIVGPANLPAEVVKAWTDAIQRLAADPAFVKEAEATGAEVAYLGPAQFKEALRVEYEAAVKQVEKLGLRR
jgi:tripartite-type tricarboxylate transporter receptor subunit TctC